MSKLILGILVLFLPPSLVSAHPGRTASDGCHYCRTNCEKWGVPEGERHCHGNRIEKKINTQANNRESKTLIRKNDEEVSGWEYRTKIRKISNPSKSPTNKKNLSANLR
jgi:hypothetical protein